MTPRDAGPLTKADEAPLEGMTRNTMLACIVLPFAVVLGIITLGLIVTQTVPPLPELETMETFMWAHKRP